MSNVKAAVRRLSFGKKARVQVKNAKTGQVVFVPDGGKKFDYAELVKAYRRESYGIKRVELTVAGVVEERPDPEDPARQVPVLHVKETGNVFFLRFAEGAAAEARKPGTEAKLSAVLEPGKGAPDVLVIQPQAPGDGAERRP